MEQFNSLLLVKDSNGQGVECNPLRRINGAKRRASLLLVKDSNGQGVECNPLRRINGAKRRAKMNII